MMEDNTARDAAASNGRTACTECQRRKQKCNREWPCNHCQRRKVADKCRFKHVAVSPSEKAPTTGRRKRRNSSDDGADESDDDDDQGPGFESLGYMTNNLFASLGIDASKPDRTAPKQFWAQPDSCLQLERALKALPPRRHMDALIQMFLSTVNFHYYIVYPPVFLQEYQTWWDRRNKNKPLGVQWTCLILMVCAVTTQHLDITTRRKLELDWGEKTHNLTERYHTAARELSSVVPVGHSHLYNVQQLLHSCYWYKAEAKFLECWHVLSTAVREAQELGLHKEVPGDQIPEFEQEIRRRIWCIIDTWDWQVSSGLGRPTIVDRTDCDVKLPSLTLESYSPAPLLYMKMQSEVVGELAARFKAPKYVLSPTDLQEYKGIIERWMAGFPAVYSFDNPDRSSDDEHPWIPFHRYYLYTMAYLLIGNPIRAYMAKVYTRSSPPDELQIRKDGIFYSLKQVASLKQWIDHITRRDGRFHFIIFSVLDTAAVLCTAIINDADHTIPSADLDAIYDAIDISVAMLRRLNSMSDTAKASFDILNRLARRVPRKPKALDEAHRKKPRTVIDNQTYLPALQPSPTSGIGDPNMMTEMLQLFQHGSTSTSPGNAYSANAGGYPGPPSMSDGFTYSTGSDSASASIDGHSMSSISPPYGGSMEPMAMPPPQPSGYPQYQVPTEQMLPGLGFGTISEAELRELSTMWEWQQGTLDYHYGNDLTGI